MFSSHTDRAILLLMKVFQEVGEKARLDKSTGRRGLSFVVEFVKISTGFATIIAVALLVLHAASAAAL